MVAFRKAKCQQSYVKSPAVQLIAMSHIIFILLPCPRCQRATTASRQACSLITSWQGHCPPSRDRFSRRRRYVSAKETLWPWKINGNVFFLEPEHSINIPSYIMRGAGKQTHVEFEIRIFLTDDRWLLLRRYSRFRELHLSMKDLYGDKVRHVA